MDLRLTSREPGRPALMGISEWMCWYANYDREGGKASDIDECVRLHANAGFDHLVWNLGRSVVDYWSDLPNTTRMCELSDQIGSNDWGFARRVLEQMCPLRRALELGPGLGLTVWGRLSMNRHYGNRAYAGATSRFALDNPQLRERSKLGNEVPSRLCYALEEVRQERIDILLEAQRLGVRGLVLDFCRQMPMLMYHPSLVETYTRGGAEDPRHIDSADPAEYAAWFEFRANILSGFMRELREAVRRQEASLGRPCAILARVPNNTRWLMVAYGLDTEAWCRDDLVDGLMLSPFPLTVKDLGLHTRYHVEVAHRHGKLCIGGVGSKGLIENGVEENTGFYDPRTACALAAGEHQAGVDAISLYQTETLVRMEYLAPFLQQVADPSQVAREAAERPVSTDPRHAGIGMDWHAHLRGRHSLRTEASGDAAL